MTDDELDELNREPLSRKATAPRVEWLPPFKGREIGALPYAMQAMFRLILDIRPVLVHYAYTQDDAQARALLARADEIALGETYFNFRMASDQIARSAQKKAGRDMLALLVRHYGSAQTPEVQVAMRLFQDLRTLPIELDQEEPDARAQRSAGSADAGIDDDSRDRAGNGSMRGPGQRNPD